MKKIIYSTIFATLLLIGISCSGDFEEINKNPNAEEEVPSSGLFSYANQKLMDNTRRAFPSGRMMLPWVQYSAQRNYTEEDRYQFRQGVNTSLYNDIYHATTDYKNIISLATNPETMVKTEKEGVLDNQIAAARIMLCYAFLQLVELYGDVPYYSYKGDDPDFQATQLNDKNIIMPKFASQEKIYKDLMKELKEASEMIDMSASNVFTKGDGLFKTPDRLKKFANSLRLRIANRVKHIIPEANEHITNAIASGVMTSNDDSVGLTYQNDDVFPSPFYYNYFVENRIDVTISNTFVDLLKGKLGSFGYDPRLQKYAAPIDASTEDVRDRKYDEQDDLSKYSGMPIGIPSSMTASQIDFVSYFSSNVLKRNYTEILMEYSEVEFILSEINGWNDDNYKNGVIASMQKWDVDQSKIDTYVNNLAPANEENVITQKYIALYMQPMEAWSEYRRTAYPKTLLKPGEEYDLAAPYKDKEKNVFTTYTFKPLVNLTDLPGRVTYPVDLGTLNPANYKAASQNIGGDKMETKLIWAK